MHIFTIYALEAKKERGIDIIVSLLLANHNLVRRSVVTTNGDIPSVGEILELAAIYRVELVAKRGEEWVKNHPISNEWGDGRTTATLLIKEPGRWDHLLDEEKTGQRVYQALLDLQKHLATT